MRRSIRITLPFSLMDDARMVLLATVSSSFHARVIAARVSCEGILTELRGNLDGLYPSAGDVHVYVSADDLPVAQELLLADEVEAAFDTEADEDRRAPAAWLVIVTMVAVLAVLLSRYFL